MLTCRACLGGRQEMQRAASEQPLFVGRTRSMVVGGSRDEERELLGSLAIAGRENLCASGTPEPPVLMIQ